MSDEELTFRIRRIYAAIDAAEERNLSALAARVFTSGKSFGVYQDFSGGLKNEDIANLAISLIDNIAKLRAHLLMWADRKGKDKSIVQEAFKASFPLQVITDLSNYDKHPYPPRDQGYSRRSPKLIKTRRVLRMTTEEKKSSVVGITLAPDGTPKKLGSGSARAIVTGEVVDDKGEKIGELYDLARKAVDDWIGVAKRLDALS